jgi:hypothetical protein
MKHTLFLLVFSALCLMTGGLQAAVWNESNQWNQSWEDRYSDWVKTSFDENIFTEGRYKGIATDCADAVYAARAIFAFENQLPFVILDPTGGSAKISNRMSRWDGQSQMSKFRSFLDYVSELTDTKSLPRDSYPVVISREFVRSGAIWSRPRIAKSNFFSFLFGGKVKEDPGHAELIKDVTDTGAIQLIGSTVPSAVRKLISTSSLVFMPIETSTGLRKWMQPSWYGAPKEQLPGYSMEQFRMGEANRNSGPPGARDLSHWTYEIQTRLQLRPEQKEESMARYGANLCNLIQARVDVIRKAEKARAAMTGCMNAEEYDSYSTPSRDKRIQATIQEMIMTGGGFGFTALSRLENVKKYMADCPVVQITTTQSMTLSEVATAYVSGKASSNPNDPLESRWGLGQPSEMSKTCPVY